MKNVKKLAKTSCIIFLLLMIASIVGIGFEYLKFNEANIIVVYVLAVVIGAKYTEGYLPSVIMAFLVSFCFNYFFTSPYYTFKVDDPGYYVVFVVLTFVSLMTSGIANKMKEREKLAYKNSEEKEILLELTKDLNNAREMEDVARISILAFDKYLGINVGCICTNDNDQLEDMYFYYDNGELKQKYIDEYDQLVDILKDYTKGYLITDLYYDFIVRCGDGKVLGIIQIPKENSYVLDDEKNKFVCSLINCTAMAMDRIIADQKHLRFKEEANLQHYRADLLRSISHDLRTPLSGIMGNCEMLMDCLSKDGSEYNLVNYIYKDSQWLYSLVENILSLTKLQEGKMVFSWKCETIDEILGAAVRVFERRYNTDIKVVLPKEIISVKVDAKLIEQVIVNLLDNAQKHANSKEIILSAKKDGEFVKISVEDFGKGIDENLINKIFEMFYTGTVGYSDSKRGIGLGLTIAKSVIEAHGGTIKGYNKLDSSGSIFEITLPIQQIEC